MEKFPDDGICEKAVLIVASHLDRGCDSSFVQFCLRRSGRDVQRILAGLARSGSLDRHDAWYVAGRLPEARIRSMTAECRGHGIRIVDILADLHAGELTRFYEESFRFFRETLDAADMASAQKIYGVFSRACCAMRGIRSPGERAAFIDASLRFLKIAQDFVWCMRQTHVWCMKCRALAVAAHDDERLAVVNAVHIFICVTNYALPIRAFHSLSPARDVRLPPAREIGLNTLIQIECFFAFLSGDYTKAINCAYNKLYAEDGDSNRVFGRILHSYSAFSALLLGEYDVALDIVNSGLQLASRLNLVVYVTLFQAFTAFILLLKNEDARACAMLRGILEDNRHSVYIGGVVWATRLLACYHYKQGDVARSYALYRDLQTRVERVGFEHGSYLTAGFVLELLTEYHLQGFPPPSGRSIHEELDILLQSPAPSLRACALRCRARVTARASSWDDPAVQADIREALRICRELRTPVELMKTVLVHLESLLDGGKTREAIALLRENLPVARRYHFDKLPGSVQDFFHRNRAAIEGGVPAPGKTDPGDVYIYHSEKMHELHHKVTVLADKDTPVFIFGESGVGKEHIARALHEKSRRPGRFVAVNLSSIPEHLFESEFFGYEKGAFTGAVSRKTGLLELADKGTLFLDEVADIPPHIQIKLLRILQEKEFMRVGGTKLLHSEFRLVAASNRNLARAVREGGFREDLFYRINVVSLHVPPLRERESDIIFIAKYYLNYFSRLYACAPRAFSFDDMTFLRSYSWPGNIRELRNYVERFVLSFSVGAMPMDDGLPREAAETRREDRRDPPPPAGKGGNIFFKYGSDFFGNDLPSLDEIKSQYVEFVYLRKNGKVTGPGNIEQTLGVGKVTAYRWIEKLRLRERYVARLHQLSSPEK